MTYVTTRDQQTKLYVKDWGTGRPVILIHGWPLSADTWDDVALALANAGMRAIAYDRRGFGRSSQPFGGYEYDTLADDLSDLIKTLNLNDVALVGFSMGGGEIARYMSRYGGDKVSQAVLIASVVPFMLQTADNPAGVPSAMFDQMTLAMKADRAHFMAGFFKSFYGEGVLSHPVSQEVLDWSRQMAMQAGVPGTLGCANAFATTDFRPDLASFKVPTLVIHGTADKTVPIDATGRPTARTIKQATLLEYEGAPHGLLATHKDRLIIDLLEFLKF